MNFPNVNIIVTIPPIIEKTNGIGIRKFKRAIIDV
jgi:hypothetical protein